MERLTTRNSVGVAVYKHPCECERCGEQLYRLPNDGNGSPTDKLAELEDLEEQGLLVRLPCKIGDTVYVKMAQFCKMRYAEAEVRDFTYFASCGFCAVIASKHFDKQSIPFSEFGKTVFRSEAEAKLKENGEEL